MSESVNPLSPEEVAQFNETLATFNNTKDLSHAEALFHLLDRNRNGLLSREEIRIVMNQVSAHGFSDGEAQRFVETFDKNGDGQIDLREFVEFLRTKI
ncbi:unnamed protein product [Blepharisma stoltei]|uniref:EF-hand domain-containing protein n=1 Tax=Blepharisma stoltei TaxID=1481888 RepID=A0AAU9JBR5_9CILI|nr:unnamed protein product [Blepharisma stoltei]